MKIGEIELTDWILEGDDEHNGKDWIRKIVGRNPGENFGVAINQDRDSNHHHEFWKFDVWFFRELRILESDFLEEFLENKNIRFMRFKDLETAKETTDEFLRWVKMKAFQ
jgi:hypothetical protein